MKNTFLLLCVLLPALASAATLPSNSDPKMQDDSATEGGKAPFILSTDCKAMGCATRPRSIFSNVNSGPTESSKDTGAVH